MASYVLGIVGFLIAVGTFVFCHERWRSLSVIDLLVFSCGISFGAYSIVEAFIQQDYITSMRLNPSFMLMVMLHVLIITALTRVVLQSLHQKYQRVLRLRYIVQHWLQIGELQGLLLLAAIIVVIVYGLFKFGVIGYLRFGLMDKADIMRSAPYWYTSILPFLPVLIYTVALSAAAKISYRCGNTVTWVTLLLALLICMLYGRRQVFYLMLLLGIIWYLPRDNLFSLKNAKFFILIFFVTIVFSNIYQTYRKDIPSASTNLLKSWDDTSVTMSNLQDRIGPWSFSYLIMESKTMPMKGAFFLQTVKNSIPRVFWPDKVIYDEDAMVADHYGLLRVDYPNTPFSTGLADFGFMSVFIIPLFYLFTYISAAYFFKKFRRFPLLYSVLSVMLLQFTVSIETAFYAAFFGLYRYGTVVVVLYFTGCVLLKLFKLEVKTDLENKNKYAKTIIHKQFKGKFKS